MSGSTIERRDQVLIGRRSFFAVASETFFAKCVSTNGPFLTLRGISFSYLRLSPAGAGSYDAFPIYLRLRRRTIMLSVRLFDRVLAPFVGVPHGLTG